MIKTKENTGVTLVSLIITIVLILIISSTAIYTSYERFELNKFKKLINDLELLSDKVSNYYLKYNALPVVRNENNESVEYKYTSLDFEKNENYYILDLQAMEGISLNYGKEGFENLNASDDVYIINEASHTIYYVKGIKLNEKTYHTLQNDDNIVDDTIPPTKPEIKVISGTQNYDGSYMTEVELEFVPGKDKGKVVSKTEYSLDGGNTWEDIDTVTNNIYKITTDGTYNIKARSYDTEGNISENETNITVAILRIGDKVAYNEGTEKTSSIDSNFAMDNLEWRILDIEDEGTVKLISTKPTTSTLALAGAEGWLNAEKNLDTLCNDLYGKGIGAVTARSLKKEDVNKLAGITEKDRKALDKSYGSLWRYKYSTITGYIQYSRSEDDGETWSEYTDSKFIKFKEPGKEEINSINNTQIAELKYTNFNYTVEDRVSIITTDGISVGSLITQGLNDKNTAASGTNIEQWISSCTIVCYDDSNPNIGSVGFAVDVLRNGEVRKSYLDSSYDSPKTFSFAVRPVVILKPDIQLTKVNGIWQISE